MMNDPIFDEDEIRNSEVDIDGDEIRYEECWQCQATTEFMRLRFDEWLCSNCESYSFCELDENRLTS